MKIKVDKETFDNLDDEDRLVVWLLQLNKDFERIIMDAREKIGIPPDGWGNPISNYYGQGHEHTMRPLFVEKSGDLKSYGDWVRKRTVIRKLRTKIDQQVRRVLERYKLADKWCSAIENIICYGELSFIQEKIEARQTDDDAVAIVVHGTIDSTNRIKKWIDKNWEILQAMSVKSTHKKAEISGIPKYEKWDYYNEILRLRDEEKRTFSDIAQQLSNRDVPVKVWDDGTINEQSVKVAYHRLKKILHNHNLQWPPKSSPKR